MKQKAHKNIEDVLNILKKSIRDFSKDAERLSEDDLISESSDPLYQHINDLYTLKIKINDLILSVLSDDFSPQETKNLLEQTQSLRLLTDSSNAHSPLANVLRDIDE